MIFIDRSIPRGVARALQNVRDDVLWLEDKYAHNTKDPVWLPDAGTEGWLVISRDKGIRYKPAEIQAIKDNRVGCFILAEKNDLSRWNLLKIIVTKLDDMILRHEQTERPFIYLIDASGAFKKYL